MSEHDLQNAIIQWLTVQGLYALRVNSGKIQNALTGSWVQLAEHGHPDIVCSTPDKSIGFIEVKSPTGALSMDQITYLRTIASKGLKWLVADDLDDLDKWLHDSSYHGKDRHIKRLDTAFAYSKVPVSKKKPITSNQFLEFELFSRDKKV
jgi:hypothetical protein